MMLAAYRAFVLLMGLVLGLCLNFLVIDTFLLIDFNDQLFCTIVIAAFSSFLTIKSLR